MPNGTMAITMAGFGNRFRAAGYTIPKYRIEALGKPLFDWSMLSLTSFREAGWDFSFAVRRADKAGDFIRARCDSLGFPVRTLLELEAPTDGQATTAKILAQEANAGEPFAVYNIDTFVSPGAMSTDRIPAGCDGWLPCFPGAGDAWSFARLDADSKVVELREKQRISNHATLGLYWFASAQLYLDTYQLYFGHAPGQESERYVAPMYNALISQGREVRIGHVQSADVGALGTPEQVDAFVASPPRAALEIFESDSQIGFEQRDQ